MPKKITIRGTIGWSENATPEFLEKELAAAGGDDIDLEFSSPGGFVYPGLEMANMVRNYPGKVVAKITGLAASMSSYIPMMADEVTAEDNAVYMIHNVSGIEWGDFRALEKYAKHLRGLRDVLAKAYVSKTGKSLKAIQTLMDDETFYYGDEIKEAGFADNMIEASDDGDDKDTAMILAREEITACVATMKENSDRAADDFKQAAAFLKVNTPEATSDTIPPAAAGKTNKEASKMSLKELLATDPEAKATYDADIKAAADTARKEGEVAGKKEGMETMQACFDAGMPILSSADYPEVVKERVTAKMKAGDVEGMKDFVALHDMNKESVAANDAEGEQDDETPASGPTGKADQAEQDFQARLDAKGRK